MSHPRAAGSRNGRSLAHTTLIPSAQPVYRALLRAGIVASPGVIMPQAGRGSPRVTVVEEQRRWRLIVVGSGRQHLLVFGNTTTEAIKTALQRLDYGLEVRRLNLA